MKKLVLLVTILIFMINAAACGTNNKAVKGNPSNGSDTAQGTSKDISKGNTNEPSNGSTTDPSKVNPGDPSKGGTTGTSQGGVIQRPSDDDTAPRPDNMNKTVFYNKSNELFHYDSKCLALKKGAEVYSGKLVDAIKEGHKMPCRLCIPQ